MANQVSIGSMGSRKGGEMSWQDEWLSHSQQTGHMHVITLCWMTSLKGSHQYDRLGLRGKPENVFNVDETWMYLSLWKVPAHLL